MKRFLALLLVLLPSVLCAQQTPVTATIKDPSANPYSFGTGYSALVCPGNQQPTFNGSPILQLTIPIPGIDGNGTFSQTLYDENAIAPATCKYVFHICARDGVTCFITGQIGGITGGTTVNLSAAINAFAVPLSIVAQPASLAGNNAFTGSNTEASINNILFVDGTKYATLASAMAACPTATCVIYDSVSETWSANPFASLPNTVAVELHLLRGTWVTNASVIVPQKSQVIGSGRGDPNSYGTVIQAGASFPSNSTLVQIGQSPGPDFGVRVENLTIDCNNKTGAVGLQNLYSQEQSGGRHLLITNCANKSLDVESSSAQDGGDYSDLEILDQASCTNCSATTVPVVVKNAAAFRGIHGITINSNGATQPNVGMQIDSQGSFSDIHCEHITSCIVVGSQQATAGVVVYNEECGPTITDCLKISNSFTTQNVTGIGIASTTGNIITDQINGVTLTQAAEGGTVQFYQIGNGTSLNLITSSANFPSYYKGGLKATSYAPVSGVATRGFPYVADQGTPCTNAEILSSGLSAGWALTGSANVTAAAGNGQTCSWTITTGTTTGANPTVTDTLTNALPNATTRCWMFLEYGPASTHTAAAGEGFAQTTLSATAPAFTFNGTPTAGGKTYLVVRTCGP